MHPELPRKRLLGTLSNKEPMKAALVLLLPGFSPSPLSGPCDKEPAGDPSPGPRPEEKKERGPAGGQPQTGPSVDREERPLVSIGGGARLR
jgi:hypothetical protein